MVSGLGLKKISTEAVDGYTRIASRNRTAWCDLHASREIGMQVERRSCAACVSQGFRIRPLVREASLQMAHASITGSVENQRGLASKRRVEVAACSSQGPLAGSDTRDTGKGTRQRRMFCKQAFSARTED